MALSVTPSAVYRIELSPDETVPQLAHKTVRLLEHVEAGALLRADALCAIKQHFGEQGNHTYLKPGITRAVVDYVKKHGANPILVETNTLYHGQRSDSYHHLMCAYEHGFTPDAVGAPIVIMDGVNGQNQQAVAIPGTHYSEVFIAGDVPFFDSLIVLSHVKGHMMAGMGGAIKNLAMGMASRAGKLAQHADFRPTVDYDTCTKCRMCTRYCPTKAIAMGSEAIEVDRDGCIGCGECYAACRFGAISFDWGSADATFQEKMAEHALGAALHQRTSTWFLNYIMDITRQCDCWGDSNPVMYGNAAILASRDPVAIDRASVDIATEAYGHDVFKKMWPQFDASVQMKHAEAIGLGSCTYELVDVAER
jgi:uncharacterized protein